MSTACMSSLASGCAERSTHAMEYTSAPLLEPRTAILTLRPPLPRPESLRSNSNSGRFRRKKVPRYIRRSCRRTSECSRWPKDLNGPRAVKDGGRRFQIHSFSRNQAPTGDLPNIRSLAILRSEEHTSELQSHLNLVCRL